MACPLDENGQTECPSLQSPDLPWYFNGDIIVIVVVLCVVVPLASLKNIEFLGYTSGFSISCMVFFTIIIVVKYFKKLEKCPLFEDGIAGGDLTDPIWNQDHPDYVSNDRDTLRHNYLEPNNATNRLMDTYINGTSESYGHISDTCPSAYKLPEEYCNLNNQVCKTGMFIVNEKVPKVIYNSILILIFRLYMQCQQ